MIYEIINPSDKATFEAPDDNVAAAAALLLGDGFYGCEREDGESLHTLVVFGGEAAIKHCLGLYFPPDGNINAFMDARGGEVAAALDTLMYCGAGERKALEAAFDGLGAADRIERLRKYNDERRSSLNDIGRHARQLAENLRARTPGGGAPAATPEREDDAEGRIR